MAKRKSKSVEEKVEDRAKRWLKSYNLEYYTKTDEINSEIDTAMLKAPSKQGGAGGNRPDIRLLLQTSKMKQYPIMIEVKGAKDKLVKLNAENEIDNVKKDGEPHYANINGFAVNGAVHYAKAIVEFTDSYKEVIAIGINGYEESGKLETELGVYYVSGDNFCVPKKVGEYDDLSFLAPTNFKDFIKQVEQLKLTPKEIEAQRQKIEDKMEVSLKDLNETMHSELHISEAARVKLVVGMIMAGLGVDGKVAPLDVTDLKGEQGDECNDGRIIMARIKEFLTKKDLPKEKREMILTDLSSVIVSSGLSKLVNGESKLKTVFVVVKNEILPIFKSSHHLDFTGRLFNVLNRWVKVPDMAKNDVVLTPRYVTDMMAKLAKVDCNSYVWDYATGSAGFLISSMNLMIADAEAKIKSPEKLAQKKNDIKVKQLLGIEILPDIYLLAVLNMILMEDGSTNILHKDALNDYCGQYEQGSEKGKDFPANVFLLNPPYSAAGKGFIFVERALARMKNGRAVVLIQENAGSGSGLPFTKNLLKNNSLLASIYMADIFCGKASVQTAVYVFEVGKAHNVKQPVKFIDMTNDGYTRQNRKKSGLNVNLRNTDHADERYQEVVDLVLYGKKHLKYFTEDEYIEDVITLEGNDWTFAQHKKIDTVPTEADFMKVVSEYLAWEVGQVLRGEQNA